MATRRFAIQTGVAALQLAGAGTVPPMELELTGLNREGRIMHTVLIWVNNLFYCKDTSSYFSAIDHKTSGPKEKLLLNCVLYPHSILNNRLTELMQLKPTENEIITAIQVFFPEKNPRVVRKIAANLANDAMGTIDDLLKPVRQIVNSQLKPITENIAERINFYEPRLNASMTRESGKVGIKMEVRLPGLNAPDFKKISAKLEIETGCKISRTIHPHTIILRSEMISLKPSTLATNLYKLHDVVGKVFINLPQIQTCFNHQTKIGAPSEYVLGVKDDPLGRDSANRWREMLEAHNEHVGRNR